MTRGFARRFTFCLSPPPPPHPPPPALGATLPLMGVDLTSLSRLVNTIAPPRFLLQAQGTTVCCLLHFYSATVSGWFRRPQRRQETPREFTHSNVPSRRASASTSPRPLNTPLTPIHPHLLTCPLLSLSRIISQTQHRHHSPIMIGTVCTRLTPQHSTVGTCLASEKPSATQQVRSPAELSSSSLYH